MWKIELVEFWALNETLRLYYIPKPEPPCPRLLFDPYVIKIAHVRMSLFLRGMSKPSIKFLKKSVTAKTVRTTELTNVSGMKETRELFELVIVFF